jgi:hypothetical protein
MLGAVMHRFDWFDLGLVRLGWGGLHSVWLFCFDLGWFGLAWFDCFMHALIP